METGYREKKFTVCMYEFLGTGLLMLSVIMSAGHAMYIVLTFWTCLMIAGGISGGHFNPAVSTGVFVWRRKFDADFSLYSGMVIA
jgi:aquaporin Z